MNFRHAAALTSVCVQCHSCVVRTDQDVAARGKVAPLARDLSPLQVGARGTWNSRNFEVVGVLRKGRPGVRWNEWFVAFDDFDYGWLSDGNGEFQLFEATPAAGGLPDPRGLPAGSRIQLGEQEWRVTEAGSANILAAEGELPLPVAPNESFTYCDLKDTSGRAGTLDRDHSGQVVLWVGRTVELSALQLTGIRPFAGFEDPAIVAFAGPTLSHVRTLQCPSCAAPLDLRAPGSSETIACSFCGSRLGAGESGGGIALKLLEASRHPPFTPAVPLGSLGTLRGVKWQVIGAMVRFVRADGQDWNWTEYLLFNPYRGFAFLVEDSGHHWSFVRKLASLPAAGRVLAKHRGEVYKAYQSGVARVRHVLGEFFWEVRAGDSAATKDFVAPPRMISYERTEGEVNWSQGEYLPAAEVGAAFGLSGLPSPTGVAPHQPNPYDAKPVRSFATTGLLVLLVLVAGLGVGRALLAPERVLHTQGWMAQGTEGGDVWISDEFDVGGGLRRDLGVTVQATTGTLFEATTHAALLAVEDGKAHLIKLARSDTGGGQVGTGHVVVPKGRYVARVELATAPGSESSVRSGQVLLQVKRAPGSAVPWLFCFAGLALFGAARPILASSFEGRRWGNSDLGESASAWAEHDDMGD